MERGPLVSDAAPNPNNFCYRHPDRQSFILCQRCGRTICTECQTQAPVGVHCPECTREARQSAPRTKPAVATALGRLREPGAPVVTYAIIALTLAVFGLQFLTGGAVTTAFAYWPPYTVVEPWRMLTTALVHSQSSIFHILFNMYALFLFGRMLERMLGRWRFLALYVLTTLGGSLAVLLLSPMSSVVGASGAIFGLFGAFFVINRGLGGNSIQLIVIVGLNLAIGFVVPNISWQAHVGGLVVGALMGLVFMKTRRRDQQKKQLLLLGAVLAGIIALTIVGVILMYAIYA